MKKTLALLLALLMLAACLAGCAAKQETPAAAETTAAETSNQPVSEETYYYICPLANLEYWLAHKAGLEDACRELNVTPKFVGDDGLDVDAMCAVIETALNDPNCAGIVMQANFADAYEPYVQQAYEKGIPVCYQTVDGVRSTFSSRKRPSRRRSTVWTAPSACASSAPTMLNTARS